MIVQINGTDVLIDEADISILNASRWYVARHAVNKRWKTRYTVCRTTDNKALHRIILNAPAGLDVDHIDGNTLNNTRANLRLCTRGQNAKNRGKCFMPTTSQFKGVFRKKVHHSFPQWQAHIGPQSRYILGAFHTEIEAAVAYDFAALMLYKEFARTNFKFTRDLFQSDGPDRVVVEAFKNYEPDFLCPEKVSGFIRTRLNLLPYNKEISFLNMESMERLWKKHGLLK